MTIYSGCNNTFFIYQLADEQDFLQFKQDKEKQEALAVLAREHIVDSVMVVYRVADADMYMAVYEPHAFDPHHLDHAWSTMCGNGIRAVAQWLYDHHEQKDTYHIKTQAGMSQIVREGNDWKVAMGTFFHGSHVLSQYVLPAYEQFLEKGLSFPWFVGFHSHNHEHPDGEPHLVVLHNDEQSYKTYLQKTGPLITKNAELFPHEINTNVAVITNVDEEKKIVSVRAATYERHIYYITQACGTGATVIGSSLFSHLKLSSDWCIRVQMPGGQLLITKNDQGEYFMTGEAHQIGKVDKTP